MFSYWQESSTKMQECKDCGNDVENDVEKLKC